MNPAPRTKIQLDQVFNFYKSSPKLLGMLIFASVFTNFVVSFDVNLYFFSSPYIVSSISSTDIYLGISASSFTLGVIIFASIGGYLFSNYSVRKLLILSIVLITFFSVLTGYVQNSLELVFIRFLFGVGNGLLQGLITSLLGGLYPRKKGLLLSLKGITFSAGMLFGPYTESIFAPGYKLPFLITGIIGATCLLLIFLFLPDIYMKRDGETGLKLRRLFNRNTTLTLLSIFFFGIGLFGFLGYFSHYMLSYLNYGNSQAAIISSMLGLGGLIMTMPVGYISDIWSKKFTLASLYIILALSSFGMFAFHPGYPEMIVFAVLFGGAYNSLINTVAASSQEWADSRDLGPVSGASFSFYYAGGVIGGPLFGLLIPSMGFTTAGLASVTILMVMGLVCSLLIIERKHEYKNENRVN